MYISIMSKLVATVVRKKISLRGQEEETLRETIKKKKSSDMKFINVHNAFIYMCVYLFILSDCLVRVTVD